MSTIEQRDLTYALILVGIRRSKLERVWEKTRASVGLKSYDLVPIIRAHRAENVVGDAARALVDSYEHAISANPQQRDAHFQILLRDLFDLYLKRQFQVTRDPWFKVNGIDLNLVNFVNTGAYQQPVPKAENTWMHLITLTPDRVQNPQLKGYSRELWWNRDRGINPLGTVRLSRNSVKQPDGTEQTLSVEVLRKTEDGYFIPFVFERDSQGHLYEPNGPRAMKKVYSCFACHLRLSGIYFGGINMPGYKAVDDWHVNAIDLTRRKYYSKFAAFR